MTLRVLVAYSASSTYVHATLEYVMALKRYSGLDVSYLHVTHDAFVEVDPGAFDVVFHSYCGRLCYEGYVSESYRRFMRSFPGLKVLAIQDEYEQTNVLKAAINDLGFHVLLTCVPADSLEGVFPRAEFPTLHFEKGLTGYMPDSLADSAPVIRPLAERPIMIGYRARALPPYYGRLGQEKYEIGRRMAEICDARGIVHDISMDDSKRIYNDAWFDFIGSCRAMLGSETGSNLFDWDGSLKAAYNRMVAERGGGAVTYEEFLPVIGDREQTVFMGEISPRVFECAIMRTPMILFRGRYSDAIEPDLHYIPLEKDFSNVDEVLRKLDDLPALTALTERAYDRLVASGQFGYKAFAQRMRKLFIEQREKLGMSRGAAVEVSELPTRTLEELLRIETPTDMPQLQEAFQRKFGLGNLSIYLDEVKRVQPILADQGALYAREMDRLVSLVRDGHSGLLGESPILDNIVKIAKLDDDVDDVALKLGDVSGAAAEFIDRAQQVSDQLRRGYMQTDRRLEVGYGLLDGAKAQLEALNAELARSNAAFTSLVRRANLLLQMVEVERVGAVLRDQHVICVKAAGELHAIHGDELKRLAQVDRDGAAGLPSLDAPTELQEQAVRSNEAEDTYRRARTSLTPDGMLPEPLSEAFKMLEALTQSRLSEVNGEILAFNDLYTRYVGVANERISEVGRRLNRRASMADEVLPPQLGAAPTDLDPARNSAVSRSSPTLIVRDEARALLARSSLGQQFLRVLRKAVRHARGRLSIG